MHIAPSKAVLFAASLILSVSMVSIAGAVTTSPVTIYNSGGTNAVGADGQGNLQTKICDPSAARCAEVNNSDLFVKVDSSINLSPYGNSDGQTGVAGGANANVVYNGSTYDRSREGTVVGSQLATVTDANGDNQVFCSSSVAISDNSSSTTQLIPLSAGKKIYVCGYDFMAAGAVNVTLESATAASCGGAVTALTGSYPMLAGNYVSKPNSDIPAFIVPSGDALCISLSVGSIQVSGVLTYGQF